MPSQIPLKQSDRADKEENGLHRVTKDLAYMRTVMVNVVFIGSTDASPGLWVLVDAGLGGTAESIKEKATERFGLRSRPACILLTHGHFDHVGALEVLARDWDVPVYAHPLEFPYLNGQASYPPPDPMVGGGLMTLLSPLFPRGPIDLGDRLRPLPEDGSVPYLSGWRWLHTPGHSPGHVSFWRPADRTLVAGDAFITTDQESAYAVMTQRPELHGPPKYFTIDWEAAHASVQALAALQPVTVVTGHGDAMQGAAMQVALNKLAADFQHIAVPGKGRYVDDPQRPTSGEAYRKP